MISNAHPCRCSLYREIALIESGFTDIYLDIKSRENANALDLLPEVLAELDAETDQRLRWELVIRGICAANIFDLGAAHTTNMYHEVESNFTWGNQSLPHIKSSCSA